MLVQGGLEALLCGLHTQVLEQRLIVHLSHEAGSQGCSMLHCQWCLLEGLPTSYAPDAYIHASRAEAVEAKKLSLTQNRAAPFSLSGLGVCRTCLLVQGSVKTSPLAQWMGPPSVSVWPWPLSWVANNVYVGWPSHALCACSCRHAWDPLHTE